MTSVQEPPQPDLLMLEAAELGNEVMISLLVAVLRLSVDTMGLTATTKTVADWLAVEAYATLTRLDTDLGGIKEPSFCAPSD